MTLLTCAGGDCKGLLSSSNTCNCTIFLKQMGITSTLLQEKSNFTKGSCTSSKSNKEDKRCYICTYFCHKIVKYFWIKLFFFLISVKKEYASHNKRRCIASSFPFFKNTNSDRNMTSIYSILSWEWKRVLSIYRWQ